MAELRVQGLNRFLRDLKRAGGREGMSVAMRAAHQRIAALVIPGARARAPKLTGRLAGSLVPSKTTASAKVRSPAGVRYANPIHWGWRARNIPRRPFIVDARDAMEGQIMAAYGKEIDGLIKIVEGGR